MTSVPTASAKNGTARPPIDEGPKSKPPPALAVDLATLSDDAVAALAAEAQAENECRKAKREAEFLEFVKERAQQLGVPPVRLMAAFGGKSAKPRTTGGTDGRSVVKPKFWNPKDHSQRWSGRGAQPKWCSDHLAAGGTEEDMSIPEGAL